MSHFSLNFPPSDTLWYTPMEHQQHQPPHHKSFPLFYNNNTHHHNHISNDDADSDNSASSNNAATNAAITNNDRSETASSLTTITTTTSTIDKEHMFEKPLTPSDVGKLNRLVIPKQHAEKYFPLAGVSSTAAAATADNDKATAGGGGGVLLGFEDEGGKCWRFRYSYWNSSQSYVLTKGWSRYVKEKKLDAGDVVLFERHRFDSDRFFIGWRRRGSPPVHTGWAATAAAAQRSSSSSYNQHHHNHQNYQNYGHNVAQRQQVYAASHQIAAYPYQQPESLHAGTPGDVRQERQKGRKSGNSKRVRLFGVNLECQLEEDDQDEDEPQTSDGSSLSSQGQGQGSRMGPTAYNYFDYVGYPPNHHNHMDINFPQDVNQMRNRLG